MKKIFVSIFLLVFTLCLVGCEQLHTGPKEDSIIDGEYYAKVIYDSPFLSSRAYSRKIIIDNNKLDDLEFIDYELQGDFFTSIPNTDKDVFSSIKNIEKIWFAEVLQPEDIEGEFGYYLTLVNSKYYLYYGRYTEDNGYSIKHAFKLVRLDTEKEILCDFLTLLNPLSVTLINGNDNSMIDKSYYDFESQLFFEEFIQIEVSKLDNYEKYDMPDVDYYISFSTFTEDFVSLQFYNVKNSDYEQYYGRIDGNLLDGIYQFSINEDLFNKVFDYFTNNTKFEESLYKLTIQNQTAYELIGIKNEYKADEEVEVKMIYEDDVCTFAFLDGELLGELTGINSIKFNMPTKDSVLTISYSDEIYKLNVIDNFDLLIVPLKEYYNAGDTVQVITKFLSGPRVDVQVDGQFLEIKELEAFGYYGYEFIMPEKDVEIAILYNGLMNKPCENNEHQWDEGVVDPSSSLSNPPIKYTCLLCGTTKKEPTEWLEHSHDYIDGLCDCGKFDNQWIIENFRVSDEQILFDGSVDDEFNCDIILLTLKHTNTYIELSKRHFGIDEITEVVYISATPPSHFYEPGNEDKLDNFNQIVFLYVDVDTKQEIIDLIKEIEKLPFVESAGPNYIEHGE